MEFAIGQCAKKIHSWVGQTLHQLEGADVLFRGQFFFFALKLLRAASSGDRYQTNVSDS